MDKLTISIYNTSMLIPAQTPLDQYGGAELICANLAKYFDEAGHKVNLFAPEGSFRPLNGVLYQTCRPGEKNADEVWKIFWENQQSKKALKESDVVLDSSWGYYPYNVANELKALMHTHHGPHPGFEGRFPFPVAKPNLIGVSPNHAKVLSKISNLEWRGVCNGINPNDYIYREEKEDYFLFLGRWDWFKAPHRAIDIAELGKKKMILAGGSFGDVNAYVTDVKNKISQSKFVKTYGSVGNETRGGMPGAGITHKEKVELLSRAKAVILPNIEYEAVSDVQNRQQWKTFIEPFGLIAIEANACGTPAIVLPSGGWHHTVVDGYNGFFAISNTDFVDKMERIEQGEIDPKNCRKIAEHFSYQRMGNNYMHLIKKVLNGEGW